MYIVHISVFIIHYIVYNTFYLYLQEEIAENAETGRNFPAGFTNGNNQIISLQIPNCFLHLLILFTQQRGGIRVLLFFLLWAYIFRK